MRGGTAAISARIGAAGAITAAVLALAVALTPAVGAASPGSPAASAGQSKRAFTVHRSRYWSWTGPSNWTASYGTYGITVQGPKSGFDLGFSTTLCSPAATVQGSVNKYLAARRAELARDVRIVGKSKIRKIGGLGPNYFRQTLDIKNTIGGKAYGGQVILDYQVNDSTYCYQRTVSLGARTNGFTALMKELLRVYNSLAYFGPGV